MQAGARYRTSSFEPAGEGLEKLVTDLLRHVPEDQAPLSAWPLVCGSAVAERTRAAGFADGVLRVEVPDARWQRELRELAPRYVAVLNRYCRRDVNRIEFVVMGPERGTGHRLGQVGSAKTSTAHESH